MKRTVIFALMLLLGVPAILFMSEPVYAQTEREPAEVQIESEPTDDETAALPALKSLNVGLGIPMEIHDLQAIGMNIHVSFDYAYPITDDFAMGFYIGLGGGFMGAVHPYSKYDRFYYPFKFSAGILMEIGDLRDRPYIFGIGPCTGLGYVDMDLILPLELRFGRFVTDHLYVMVELTYGVSLANETVYLEPSVRVGYNFGRKD